MPPPSAGGDDRQGMADADVGGERLEARTVVGAPIARSPARPACAPRPVRGLRPMLAHELLEATARTAPDRVAIRMGGRTSTYGQADLSATALASTLASFGVTRGDRVGIRLPKGPEAVVALYATLKAGGVYVPLDPSAPGVHVAEVADDCGISALVSTASLAGDLLASMRGPSPRVAVISGEDGGPRPGCPSVTYEEATAPDAAPARAGPGRPDGLSSDDALACIMYTSGSTGRPKGVMHSHRSLVSVARWVRDVVGIGPADRLAVHPPLHFVLSAYGVFPAALVGATTVPMPERTFLGLDLARFVDDDAVSVLICVPAALSILTSAGLAPGSLPSIRHLLVSGGSLPKDDVRAFLRLSPGASCWNLYGSTEAWGIARHRLDEEPPGEGFVPIGQPWEEVDVVVVREDGTEAGLEEEGELLVRTPRMTLGYWGRAGAIAESAVHDPRDPSSARPFYRTGDVVRRLPDGGLAFAGRRDAMVKTRGFRVELGEIEAALLSHPGVREAVAVALPDPRWEHLIAVFVLPRPAAEVTTRGVWSHLANRLPRYMLPQWVEIVPELPRTSTGKADRVRLAAWAASGSRPSRSPHIAAARRGGPSRWADHTLLE